MKICNPLSKTLGVLQINNVYKVEILFTVEFILFYNLHWSIVTLQLEMIEQTSTEMYFSIPILSMPKWMLYEMENAMDKCTTHTSVQIFYFQFLINTHQNLSKVTLGWKYFGNPTAEQSLNFCVWPGNYKNPTYGSTSVLYIPVVENTQNAVFESYKASFWFQTSRQALRDSPCFCVISLQKLTVKPVRKMPVPNTFCWLSKLKSRSDIFTSSHPSLCIVFVRTSVHLRVDPTQSCLSPDRATELQKACWSRRSEYW